MGSFRDYYNSQQNEGVGQFVKGVFNREYAALPPNLKKVYDLLTPQSLAELNQLRQALQVPLVVALKKYLSETGARDKWKAYQQMVPPERDPGKFVRWGQDSPGWKRF